MFKIQPNPTFRMTVMIPIAGEEDAALTLICQRWTRQQIISMGERYTGRSDADVAADVIVGWENVDAEFSKEALAKLLDAYPLAGALIVARMVEEQTQAKRKN